MDEKLRKEILTTIRPMISGEMLRLGNEFDGGYVLSKKVLNNCTFLLSLGVNNDWSFEENFTQITDKSVLMIDDNFCSRCNVKILIHSFLKFFNGKFFKLKLRVLKLHYAKVYKFYNWAYTSKGNVMYKKHFVSNRDSKSSIAFSSLWNQYKLQNKGQKILLKVDIEGSEYCILDEVIMLEKYFVGIIMEFHNVIGHSLRFLNAIKQLKVYFEIEHVHFNNYSPINKGVCDTIEVSFIHKKIIQKDNGFCDKHYPIPGLDFPNDKTKKDYQIRFN